MDTYHTHIHIYTYNSSYLVIVILGSHFRTLEYSTFNFIFIPLPDTRAFRELVNNLWIAIIKLLGEHRRTIVLLLY